MAEFCKQCTEELFGDEFKNDFIGLSNESDTADGQYCIVLCEGCGPTLADHTGKCVDPDCIKKHGELKETV